ncbi:hypothetical protein [Paracoccus sp. DMF]|uniref:hypothetical protein n=1 Tax=Paracoccus sp. DMF TaxID=400837 RepID=UPI0011000275|nr:hypothetical protein [Paracoccus sp. DMF]MCV2448675.1 hypothetical protein [Paracoccus sp. DMF]
MKRRDLMKLAPVALAVGAVPIAAAAAEMSREERIRHHAEALLALIRPDFPAEANSMSVTVGSNWGPATDLQKRAFVNARASEISRIMRGFRLGERIPGV